MTNTQQEVIRQAMKDAEHAEAGVQPAILMNQFINHTNVGEYTSCHLNDSWAPKIKELIDSGWIVFRIQTEFCTTLGHSTIMYLAKMKTN